MKTIENTIRVLATCFQTQSGNASMFTFNTSSSLPPAHVFCMMGGNAYKLMGLVQANSACMVELQRRVRGGEIVFVSNCAGSTVAGHDLRYCTDVLVERIAADVMGLGLVRGRVVLAENHCKKFSTGQSDATAGDAMRLCMPKGACLATAKTARALQVSKNTTSHFHVFGLH